MIKNILYRIPEEIRMDLLVELEWQGNKGQPFIDRLVTGWIATHRNSSELNYKKQTREDVRKSFNKVEAPSAPKKKKQRSLFFRGARVSK